MKSEVDKLEILITVVNPRKVDLILDVLTGLDVNFNFSTMGEGTADAKILSYFGETTNKKAVVFSLIKKEKAGEALGIIEDKLLKLKGRESHGIAFTIPLTSVIGVSAFTFLTNHKEDLF